MVREEEVGESAAGNRECVRQEDWQVGGVDEEAHEEKIAEERDEAVGEMEAEELCECFAGALLRFRGPCVVQVPDEVMKEGELDGKRGGEEVVARECVIEDRQRSELRDDTEKADQIKAEEPFEWAHARGSGSSRKSCEVWR